MPLTSPRRGAVVARPQHVVVLGASLAGAFAAAAASRAGHRVTVLERDVLPDAPVPRDGVPQGRQPHALLVGGLRAAEQLLPGIGRELRDAGAVDVDTGHVAWLSELGWMPHGRPQLSVLSATRPLVEHLVLRRVRAMPGVTLREGVQVDGLRRGEGDGSRWWVDLHDGAAGGAGGGRGVGGPGGAGGAPGLAADVVVDASGRSSRLPRWLERLGLPPVRVTEVDARVGYACRVVDLPPGAVRAAGVVVLATPDHRSGGIALPVEGGRWIVGATGFGDRRPPRDPDGFAAALAAARDPALSEILAAGRPVGDVAVHRQTANRWRHFEELAGWPDGLVVVGDALCAFNPVYGQGITVAALEAVELRDALARGLGPGDARRFVRRAARLVELPWGIATGEDRRFLPASAPAGPVEAVVGRWMTEVGQLAAHGDHLAAGTVSRVYHLVAPPRLLARPGLLGHAVRARLRGRGQPNPRPEILAPVGVPVGAPVDGAG